MNAIRQGGLRIEHNVTLTITSLLSILLMTFHLSDAHMRGAGLVGGRIVDSSGILFWVWTLVALGVTANFSVILSARGLWSLRRGEARSVPLMAPRAE